MTAGKTRAQAVAGGLQERRTSPDDAGRAAAGRTDAPLDLPEVGVRDLRLGQLYEGPLFDTIAP